MFCKNCGKEIKEGSAFCHECGAKTESNASAQANQIDVGAFQSAIANTSVTTSTKKKSKGKIILIAVIAFLIIIVIACAMGGDSDDNVIEADNYNGMSFNYTLSEWCDCFNESLKEVDNEFETETNFIIKSTSFQLDNTDYDTTDANVVRYYYAGSYIKENDFAISLYIDSDTEKICKCEIIYDPFTGDDMTLFSCYAVLPCIMATSDTDFDTARSILRDKVLNSDDYTYYDNNIYYQYGNTNEYNDIAIQAVSKEVYDEKY